MSLEDISGAADGHQTELAGGTELQGDYATLFPHYMSPRSAEEARPEGALLKEHRTRGERLDSLAPSSLKTEHMEG